MRLYGNYACRLYLIFVAGAEFGGFLCVGYQEFYGIIQNPSRSIRYTSYLSFQFSVSVAHIIWYNNVSIEYLIQDSFFERQGAH